MNDEYTEKKHWHLMLTSIFKGVFKMVVFFFYIECESPDEKPHTGSNVLILANNVMHIGSFFGFKLKFSIQLFLSSFQVYFF